MQLFVFFYLSYFFLFSFFFYLFFFFCCLCFFFFFKQKTAYEISACLVGSEMCIRDRYCFDSLSITSTFFSAMLSASSYISTFTSRISATSPSPRIVAPLMILLLFMYLPSDLITISCCPIRLSTTRPARFSPFCTITTVRLSGSSSFCLLYTSPSPRDRQKSRMPSSA